MNDTKYTLYNKDNNRTLLHPTIGLWNTSNIEEARSMLDDCKIYLKSIGLEHIQDNFVVIEVETGKEV